METRRRIDLCTCGHARALHFPDFGVEACRGEPIACICKGFMPNPQPVTPPPTPDAFHRISAVRNVGWWVVDVYATNKRGHGQAKQWLDAVNAAIEDLKEKKS